MRTAVFPGSFNPPTVAHVAAARAARAQAGIDLVDLAVSRAPLGKEPVERPLFEHRVEVLRRVADTEAGLGVLVTDRRLVADIAAPYDAVIMGADKWWQIHDLRFYRSVEHRDAAMASLPRPLIVPRAGHAVPGGVTVLEVAADLLTVSSSEARAGARHWMAAAAADFDDATGAWTDPDRYDRLARRPV